ncbi:Hypothetical protein P9303_24231 [Prochlorococcus marinus str. MIT 9303]|uniref:Uncharacterized protein n=1 Tax=Prochlorococcus marinus (strain MIT 9303) TaxID=59922 RepID=A2CCE4_PROM3|nr:Hypothetical protein P9303_24231 [Prochlorococcus marinus str. MIT 9303]
MCLRGLDLICQVNPNNVIPEYFYMKSILKAATSNIFFNQREKSFLNRLEKEL